MQTITTKYLGATNTQGTRIKANHTGEAKSITLPYNYALSNEGNHKEAAAALAKKLEWHGEYLGGHTKDGMIWVNNRPMYSFKT
jgi:hypothetical protein